MQQLETELLCYIATRFSSEVIFSVWYPNQKSKWYTFCWVVERKKSLLVEMGISGMPVQEETETTTRPLH